MIIEGLQICVIIQFITCIVCGILRTWYLKVAITMNYDAKLWFTNESTLRNSNTIAVDEGFHLSMFILLWEITVPINLISWCFKKFIEWQQKPKEKEVEEIIDNSKHLIDETE